MKKQIKKLLCAALSLTMVAGSIVLPTAASAEGGTTELKSWKFDFGSADNVETGYYSITKDTAYATNTAKTDDGKQFGLLGIDDNAYEVGNHVDGVETLEKQKVIMKEGAKASVSAATDDFVGVDKPADIDEEPAIAGNYPIRFSMDAENNHYYNVKVTVTGFDQTKTAIASVFSERRHPIILEKTIAAGETETVEFTATLQNVYIKGRDGNPTITYQDNMLNVVAVGDNVAISSIEVTEVEHKTTMWLYTDSTGCDYAMLQPYFPLQNYAGTGAFLTKYLPKDVTIANQGDGGINAADSQHWDCAKGNIQAGDYVYVQYGHNHKDDGPLGYLKAIPKYYEYAHSKGAKTIYAGPIDRHNANQYNDETNTWSSTLSGFSKAAKYYTEVLITGGKTEANAFVAKAESDGLEAAYAYADTVIANGITSNGATDVAFIDLNQPTLDWMSEVCTEVKEIRAASAYEANATNYYFRGVKGGGVDGTHANDAGADNTAAFFFDEAKKLVANKETSDIIAVQAAVIEPLVTDMRNATPYTVSSEVISQGKAPNTAWPDVYSVSTPSKYPTAIKSIQFNDDGSIASAVVLKQVAEDSMSAYGIVVVTVKNADGTEKGKFYANDQVDNSVNATQKITSFRSDTDNLTLADGDTYSAIVMQALDADQAHELPLRVDEEANHAYSIEYTPEAVTKKFIFGEDGTGNEKFIYDGAKYDRSESLAGKNNWELGGSAERSITLGMLEADNPDDNIYYATVTSTGTKSAGGSGSFYLSKKLGTASQTEEIGTSGKYMIKMDLSYVSGGGVNFGLSNGTSGNALTLFSMEKDGVIKLLDTEAGAVNKGKWATVKCILDMDYGTATITVDGYDPVTVKVPNYGNFGSVTPEKLTYFSVDGSKDAAFGFNISDFSISQLAQEALPQKSITVSTSDVAKGTAYIGEAGTTGQTVTMNDMVTLTAVPADGYQLLGWRKGSEEGYYAYTNTINVRVHDTVTFTAVFEEEVPDKYTYLYHETFKTLTTASLANDKWVSPNAQDALTVEYDASNRDIGSYLRFGKNDNSRGATKAFDQTYQSDKGLVFAMNAKFTKSSGDPNEIAVHSGNITYNENIINYGCTGGYILYLKQTNDGAITINNQATKIPDNTWFYVQAVCDFTTHKVKVLANSMDGKTNYFEDEVDMADSAATGIVGMYYKFGKKAYGSLSMDNIEIFTADQLPPDPVVIGEPTVDNGTVSLAVTNNTDTAMNARLLVASYNADGTLAGVEMSEATSVGAAEQAGVNGKGTTVTFTAPVTTSKYKIMLWDGAETMNPLIDAVDSPAETK